MHHEMAPAAPPGIFEYLVVAISVVVLLAALWIFIRGFARPGEKESDHIKRKVLDDRVPRSRR